MDKNIIGAPKPIRWVLAKLISIRRSKREAGESYGELGDKSPLLENTRAQAKALQKELPEHMKAFVSMRYWHPMAKEIGDEVKKWGAEQVLLLPLYPQYSTTTTKSSIEDWKKNSGVGLPTSIICCYPFEKGFIDSAAANVLKTYNSAKKQTGKPPRVLFSAHGLPEKIVKSGDPYQWQCEQSAAKIAKAMGVKDLDWQICYQSRVGPLKWIGPSTEEAIEKAAIDDVPVVIFPHAFTQEHVETLVELDIEYKEYAEERGLKGYYRAETVSTHKEFIAGLKTMVLSFAEKEGVFCETGQKICPNSFKRCPLN